MKKYWFSITAILATGIFFLTGCGKEGEDSGQAVFWNNAESLLGYVVVIMEDETSGNITLDYSSAPGCNSAAGCFVYSNSPGAYSYVASEEDSNIDGLFDYTLEGVVTIMTNWCKSVCLRADK